MSDPDPDAWRFREYAEGHSNDSPVDFTLRDGAPRRHTGDDGDCWCDNEDCERGDYDDD